MNKEFWYRFEDRRYAYCIDPDADYWGSTLKVNMHKYEVVKTTACGAWIDLGFGHTRFCRRDARRRFAAPSIELARESFIARKKKQISIHQSRINDAQEAIRIATNGVFL